MSTCNDYEGVKFYQKGYDELYKINTLLNVTKNRCQELEFKGEYYGIPYKKSIKLSSERNDYITMLEIISDKVSSLMSLYNLLEKDYSKIPTIAADK